MFQNYNFLNNQKSSTSVNQSAQNIKDKKDDTTKFLSNRACNPRKDYDQNDQKKPRTDFHNQNQDQLSPYGYSSLLSGNIQMGQSIDQSQENFTQREKENPKAQEIINYERDFKFRAHRRRSVSQNFDNNQKISKIRSQFQASQFRRQEENNEVQIKSLLNKNAEKQKTPQKKRNVLQSVQQSQNSKTSKNTLNSRQSKNSKHQIIDQQKLQPTNKNTLQDPRKSQKLKSDIFQKATSSIPKSIAKKSRSPFLLLELDDSQLLNEELIKEQKQQRVSQKLKENELSMLKDKKIDSSQKSGQSLISQIAGNKSVIRAKVGQSKPKFATVTRLKDGKASEEFQQKHLYFTQERSYEKQSQEAGTDTCQSISRLNQMDFKQDSQPNGFFQVQSTNFRKFYNKILIVAIVFFVNNLFGMFYESFSYFRVSRVIASFCLLSFTLIIKNKHTDILKFKNYFLLILYASELFLFECIISRQILDLFSVLFACSIILNLQIFLRLGDFDLNEKQKIIIKILLLLVLRMMIAQNFIKEIIYQNSNTFQLIQNKNNTELRSNFSTALTLQEYVIFSNQKINNITPDMARIISLKLGVPEAYIKKTVQEIDENIQQKLSFHGWMMIQLQKAVLKYFNILSKDPYALLIFLLLINENLRIDEIVNKQNQLKLQNHRFLKNVWCTISQFCPLGLCLFNQNTKNIEYHNSALEVLLGVQSQENSQLVQLSQLKIKKRQIKQQHMGELVWQKQEMNQNQNTKTKSLLQVIIDLVQEIQCEQQSDSIDLEEKNNILFRFNVIKTNKNIIIKIRNITLEGTNCSIVTFLPIDQIQEIEFNKQLQRFDQQYTSSVANDLLNPLNHIKCINLLFLNNIKQIQHISLSETLQQQQEILQLSVENMENLIQNMIDLTLIRTSNFKFKNTSFELHQELENIIKTQKVQTQIKGLKLKLKIEQTVPKFIHSDLKRIKQIIITLLQNAIKFTDKGNVYLHCKLDQEYFQEQPVHLQLNSYENPDIKLMRDKGQIDVNKNQINLRRLIFTVEDTGKGINSQDIKKLFTLFGQVESANKINKTGVGLGLAICKQLVEQFMGNIKVDSIFGKGSKFSFSIVVQDISDQNKKSIFIKKQPNFIIKQFVSLQSNFEESSPDGIDKTLQSIFNDESNEIEGQQQTIYEGEYIQRQQSIQDQKIRKKNSLIGNIQQVQNFVVEDQTRRSGSLFYNKARRRNTLRQLNNEISEIIHGLKKIDEQDRSDQKYYRHKKQKKSVSFEQGYNKYNQQQSQTAQNQIIRDFQSTANPFHQKYQQVNNFNTLNSKKQQNLSNYIFKQKEQEGQYIHLEIQDNECEVECSFDKPHVSQTQAQIQQNKNQINLEQKLRESQVLQINKKMLNKNKLNQRQKINKLIQDQLRIRRQSYVIFEAPDKLELDIDQKHRNKSIIKKFPNFPSYDQTTRDMKDHLQVDQKIILTQGQIPQILSQSSFAQTIILQNNQQPKIYQNGSIPQTFDVHQITISKYSSSYPSDPNSNSYQDPQTQQTQGLTTMQSIPLTVNNHIFVQQQLIYGDGVNFQNFEQVSNENQQREESLCNSSEVKIIKEGTNNPYQSNYYSEIPINNQRDQNEDQLNYNLNNLLDKNLRNLTPNEILKLKHKIILDQKQKLESGNKFSDNSQSCYSDQNMNQMHHSQFSRPELANSQTIQDIRNKLSSEHYSNTNQISSSTQSYHESLSTEKFKSSLESESQQDSYYNKTPSRLQFRYESSYKNSSSSLSDGTDKKTLPSKFQWQNQNESQEVQIEEKKTQKTLFKFTRTPSTIAALNSDKILNQIRETFDKNTFPTITENNEEDGGKGSDGYCKEESSNTSQLHRQKLEEECSVTSSLDEISKASF